MPAMGAARRAHVRKNRRSWEADSDEYQARHGRTLARAPLAWGVWRIPESRVRALGDLRGKDVLELGCGAAQWSIALAGRGSRPVGLDVSERQLAHARRRVARARLRVPLVQANAEELPLGDGSFDVAFADHGAFQFTDPRRTVLEAARVLRPGGLLAFCMGSPIHFLCWDEDKERVGESLKGDYWAMRTGEDEDTVQFQLPYGEWIRLFRSAGLDVEDLIELRPPARSRTTYGDFVPLAWARRWPAEQIWKARKRG